MAKNYMHLAFEGKVGGDAEMRYTPSGQAVTNFSVAVNDDYKDKAGQIVKRVTWFRVSSWGQTAEICNQYVKKGMSIIVEGRLNPDENGNPRVYQSGSLHKASFEVTAKNVRFLTFAEDSGSNNADPRNKMVPPPDDFNSF